MERSLPAAFKALGLLPLAEREVRLGGIRRVLAPVLILAAAMVVIATTAAKPLIHRRFFAVLIALHITTRSARTRVRN